jgi:EAL domain-containing protein (putative c-di-GMP-specific phosphodiesterase class I)/CheY-like chemotaxis protein
MSKILVIEDETLIRENMEDILRFSGYEVVSAGDGVEGVAAVMSNLPDLIICDIMLPGMNGFDLLHAVRTNSETKNIPFIFVSALSSRSDLRTGMELGADDYISKPFEANELIQAVETRLKRAKDQEETNTVAGVLGLPGMSSFRELNHEFYRRDGEGMAAILFIIRELYQVRAALGIHAYNKIIKILKERIENVCGEKVNLFYLEAGDFALLLPETNSTSDLLTLVKDWMNRIREPIDYDGHQIHFSLNTGVSQFPNAATGPEDLLECAAIALRQSFITGKNSTIIFEQTLPAEVTDGFRLAMQIPGALDRHEFRVYYQPQFNLKTGKLYGMEALIRWQHPELGLLSPFNFLPQAEEIEIINKMGEWVLEDSCHHLKAWQQYNPDLILSVNVSPMQLDESGFDKRVLGIIENAGLSTNSVHLEVTENLLMDIHKGDEEFARDNMDNLVKAGIEFAIDDFGTGYSSLSRLRDLPFTILKIDQAFVRNVHQVEGDHQIVKRIIDLSNDFNMKVITEGIEIEAHETIMRDAGSHYAQGYYYSKPVSAEDFESNITKWCNIAN